jgi:hypothetical protein
MKNYRLLILITLSFFACNRPDKRPTDVITLDVNKQYPKKEAVPIQDIADVEYIPLETNDAFLCDENGDVIYIDSDYILYSNGRYGDIFLFNGSGASISKFNRKGQGPEEYLALMSTVFDKENKEIYVHDYSERILVYDLEGQFKRKLSLSSENKENKGYNEILDYDIEHLLYYYEIRGDTQNSSHFALISKETGEIIKRSALIAQNDLQTNLNNDGIDDFFIYLKVAFKQDNYFYLNMFVTDTLYQLTPDFTFEPVLIRFPSFQKAASTWGIINAETPNYRFMTLANDGEREFSTTSLFLDKRTGEILEQNFYNADDLSKKNLVFGYSPQNIRAIDHKRYFLSIPAYQLKAAYENGELTGKLNDIAAKVGEDDNPVLMVVKFK